MKSSQTGNKKDIKVYFFQRKPHSGFSFSLEFIFNDIRERLKSLIEAKVIISSKFNSGLYSILFNAFEAYWRQGNGINHITGEIHFLNLFMRKQGVVLTVLDCGMVHRKKGLARYLVKKIYLAWPLKKAAITTVISETTKQELIKFTGNIKADIRVIPVAVNEHFIPSPKQFNKAKPVILHVGLGPNKNFFRIVDALGGISCSLNIIGKLKQEHFDALAANNIDYSNHYNLTTDEMVQQYIDCDILIFVSTFEGFGMPIVEANCVERVVVTSNISSMPEVAGDAALLVDPYSVEDIKKGIQRVITDDDYRENLIINGRRNRQRFDPETIAFAYFEIYRELTSGMR